MYIIGYSILVSVVVVGALTAIRAKDLIVAAVSLGVGSAALALIFFMLGAPYAGGFELSVGAGLVSVLFLVAINLTTSVKRDSPEEP